MEGILRGDQDSEISCRVSNHDDDDDDDDNDDDDDDDALDRILVILLCCKLHGNLQMWVSNNVSSLP